MVNTAKNLECQCPYGRSDARKDICILYLFHSYKRKGVNELIWAWPQKDVRVFGSFDQIINPLLHFVNPE